MESDGDAAYDDEFEAASEGSPRRDSASDKAPASPRAASPAPSEHPHAEARRLPSPRPSPSGSAAGYASPEVRAPTRTAPPPAARPKPQVRSALDRAPWTFAVRASRVRALRVPVASGGDAPDVGGVPALRDLRVFAVLDKQPVQSRGSRWKQDARVSSAEAARSRSPARRSSGTGVLQEAAWRGDDGELAWVVTMDRFRRLKGYSPRVKLFVFGIGANARADAVRALSEDSPRSHRESIVSLGWFFLDLRTPDLPERWFKLQNSPFGGEILVSTTFTQTQLARPITQDDHRVGTTRSLHQHHQQQATASEPRRREHSLSADSEYLRLGQGRGSDVFLFTVFIQGASKLQSVLRSSVESSEEERKAIQSGVWLSYSLFDVVVQTDVFFNLQRAEFAPIRDSFRVLSTKQDVSDFIHRQGFLSIYLCTHDRVLANADVPFDKLLSPRFFTATDAVNDEEVVTMSGTFPFGSSTDGGVSASFSIERSEELHVEGEEQATVSSETREETKSADPMRDRRSPIVVTVSQVQVRTDVLKAYAARETIELELLCGGQAVRCPIRFNAFTADYALGDCPDLSLELDQASTDDSGPSFSVTCFSSSTDHAIASSTAGDQLVSQLEGESCLPLYHAGRRLGECVLKCKPANASEESEEKGVAIEPRSVPGVSHTYRVYIGLKALRDFETSRPVVISYTNPFTNHERVETPLISVMRKTETDIPEAYCIFELHRDEASMKEAMESPVVMDVALALPDGSRDIVGSAIFSLNFLYFSDENFACSNPSCGATFKTERGASTHWLEVHSASDRDRLESGEPTVTKLKTCSIYLPIMGARRGENTPRRVGAVQVEAYFENAGPMTDVQVRLAEEMRVSRLVECNRRKIRSGIPNSVTTTPKVVVNSTSATDITEQAGTRQDRYRHEEREDATDKAQLDVSRLNDTEDRVEEVRAQLLNERSVWLHDQKMQQTQWKKRAADVEKARMDELEEEWARREEERSAVLKAAQAEYQKLEHTLRVTLTEVETRERKLALAESALERDQRMLREDMDLLRKRLQSEQSHSLSLAQKQIEALEKRVAELQANLEGAEKRALQVEEDFAEYRKQQRKVPESKLREEISSLKGQVAELEKAKNAEIRARENAEGNVEKMKIQLEKMAKLVQAEKKKNESRVMDDLEKLRLKYIAREERYVLDGDREELRAIKKQLEDLRRVHVTSHHAQDAESAPVVQSRPRFRDLRVTTRPRENESLHSNRSSVVLSSPRRREGRRHSWSSNEASSPTEKSERRRKSEHSHNNNSIANDRELRRLEGERDALLASGVYDEDSYLIRELERRIVLRQDQLAQH